MVKKHKCEDNILFVTICIVLSIFAIVAIFKLIATISKKDTLIVPDEETCKKCKGE
jgi:hypothetical protein